MAGVIRRAANVPARPKNQLDGRSESVGDGFRSRMNKTGSVSETKCLSEEFLNHMNHL